MLGLRLGQAGNREQKISCFRLLFREICSFCKIEVETVARICIFCLLVGNIGVFYKKGLV